MKVVNTTLENETMKVVTEQHWGYPPTKRGWYVANSNNRDIAGPFVHRHQAVAYIRKQHG